MKKLKITLHWSFILLGVLMIVFGKFTSFVCCMLSVLLHEFGHAIVGRRLGYQLNIITLMPYGAMLSGKNTPFKSGDDIKIAVAGPLVNVILIAILLIFWIIFPQIQHILKELIYANIYTLCFNILPIYPLDGGRILIGILTKKMSRIKALKVTKIVGYLFTIAIFALFFVSFFFKLNYMLGINALFLLIGLLEEDTSPYYEKVEKLQNEDIAKHFAKSIKLDKSTPIFLAYKEIQNKNISYIKIMDKNKVIATIPSKKVMTSVLKLPIDTNIENLV